MPNITVPPLVEDLLKAETPRQAAAAIKLTLAIDLFRNNRPVVTDAIWEKSVKMISTSPTAPTITVASTTGYARMVRWDGTLAPPTATNQPLNAGTAISGPYNTRLPKLVLVYSCDLAGQLVGEITQLSIMSSGVTELDLSAISATSLTHLTVYDNFLTSLDVSRFTNLVSLVLDTNRLTEIDVSANVLLTMLTLSNNLLTKLDVRANVLLYSFSVTNNRLTELDVRYNTLLNYLGASLNQLQGINLSANTNLVSVALQNNQLNALSLITNTQLVALYFGDNNLTSIDLSNNASIEWLSCPRNNLTEFICPVDSSLIELYVEDNALTSLDTNGAHSLEVLHAWGNELTQINLDTNTLLSVLFVEANFLTSLSLAQNPQLTRILCNSNRFTSATHDAFYNSFASELESTGGTCVSGGQLGNVTAASAARRTALVTAPGIWTLITTAAV
jgi:hypothetical protein